MLCAPRSALPSRGGTRRDPIAPMGAHREQSWEQLGGVGVFLILKPGYRPTRGRKGSVPVSRAAAQHQHQPGGAPGGCRPGSPQPSATRPRSTQHPERLPGNAGRQTPQGTQSAPLAANAGFVPVRAGGAEEPRGTGAAGGDAPTSGPHPERSRALRGAGRCPPDGRGLVNPRGHPALGMTKENSQPRAGRERGGRAMPECAESLRPEPGRPPPAGEGRSRVVRLARRWLGGDGR